MPSAKLEVKSTRRSGGIGCRLGGTRCNLRHRFGAAAVEDRVELLKDLLAHDFAVAVDEPKNSEEHEHDWREGKHCVIGQSRSQLGRFILHPMVERSLKQADGIRQYVGSGPWPP